jgi:hypothetical protein
VVVLAVLAYLGGSGGEPEPTESTGASEPVAASEPGGESTAASDPAAPSAPAANGDYGVGDRIQLGNEEYITVTEVNLAVDTTGELFQPDAGNKFVAALVEIEGINPDGATYNPFFFKLRDDQGFEYNFSPFGMEPQLQSSNDLAPGETVRGWVNFEVPETATTLVLIYAPGFFNEPVQINLN